MNRMRIRDNTTIVVADNGRHSGALAGNVNLENAGGPGQDLQIIVVAGSAGSPKDQRYVSDGLKRDLCIDLAGRNEQDRHGEAVYGETTVGQRGGQRHVGGGQVDRAELISEYCDQT